MQLENHHRKEQMRVVHYQPSLEDNLHRLYCRKQEKSHKLKERTVSRECSTRVMPNKGRSCCLPSYQSCSAKGENPKWKYPHLQRMALLKQASGYGIYHYYICNTILYVLLLYMVYTTMSYKFIILSYYYIYKLLLHVLVQ